MVLLMRPSLLLDDDLSELAMVLSCHVTLNHCGISKHAMVSRDLWVWRFVAAIVKKLSKVCHFSYATINSCDLWKGQSSENRSNELNVLAARRTWLLRVVISGRREAQE
jgi:hypothetical protein